MSKQAHKTPEEKVDGYLHAALMSLNIAVRLAPAKRAKRIQALATKVDDLREDRT